jgi:3-dehydroquinate synthase
MKPTTIQVELGDRSYPIRIGEAWIDGLGVALGEAGIGPSSLLVTDESVGPIWADRVAAGIRGGGLAVESIQIASGERAKSLESVRSILDFALERRCDRTTAIVALGGGVVGDVAGFAAAILLRGVPLVQVPTTLLAMVDASVGGKTGVNHPMGKNLIGAFKQPDLVAVDLAFLETLSEAEYRSGLAEVVKYGAIADARFFEFIEANAKALLQRKPEPLARAVARSCEIKAQVVAADELESGLRAILNFGHTFAHAFEATAGFGSIRHGEAVAMGMMAACRSSRPPVKSIDGWPP